MKNLPFFLFCLLFMPLWAVAATLSLDPASGAYGPGDTFAVTVRIDTDSAEECVNAIDARIEFPKNLVKPVAISRGESLISLWTQEPSFSIEDGWISIQGGIPGGYCGRVVGDPGKTNAIAKILFAIPSTQIGVEAPRGKVSFDLNFLPTSVVLLNDGSGTPARTRLIGATYDRLTEPTGSPNEWVETIRTDAVPPEEFRAEIVRDPNIHDGKFVLVFSTVDKQSGLSHYEVVEEDPKSPGMIRGKKTAAIAVRATSPYLLSDQSLESRIIVRAVDHAGNKREVVVEPHERNTMGEQGASSAMASQLVLWSILGLVLVVFVFGLGQIIRKRRTAQSDAEIDDHPPAQ